MEIKKHKIMSKEVKMTFWVDSELQGKFFSIAFLEDRSAAEVLREFMKSYIKLSHQYNSYDEPPAVNNNLLNDLPPDMEYGYVENIARPNKPSDEALKLARRIINGEISLYEVVQTKQAPEPVANNSNKEECKETIDTDVAPVKFTTVNSGYKPSKEELEQAFRFLNGEIKLSEFIIK